MQEIIDSLAAQIGIEPDLAHKATSMLANFISTQVPAEYVEMITTNVPTFSELAAAGAPHIEEATAGSSAGGGLFGAIGGLFGGDGLGTAMAMLGHLQKDGLDMDQLQQIAGGLIGHLREVAGTETVDKLIAEIPGVGRFLA